VHELKGALREHKEALHEPHAGYHASFKEAAAACSSSFVRASSCRSCSSNRGVGAPNLDFRATCMQAQMHVIWLLCGNRLALSPGTPSSDIVVRDGPDPSLQT